MLHVFNMQELQVLRGNALEALHEARHGLLREHMRCLQPPLCPRRRPRSRAVLACDVHCACQSATSHVNQEPHMSIRNITRSRAVLACDVALARESVCPHVPFQTKFENDAKGDDDDDVHYYKSLQCESEGHKHGGDEGRKRCWKFATKGSTCRGRRRAALRRGCRR